MKFPQIYFQSVFGAHSEQNACGEDVAGLTELGRAAVFFGNLTDAFCADPLDADFGGFWHSVNKNGFHTAGIGKLDFQEALKLLRVKTDEAALAF